MNPDDRIFRTSRTLPFAPDAVYAAFQSPALLAAWWGPEGFTNTFEVFEFKAGGRWTFVMHGPDGKDYPNQSLFDALEPGRKVVIRHDCAPYFTLTIRLVNAAGGTNLNWEQAFDDAATAQAVKHVVVPANEQNLDRLAGCWPGNGLPGP
ncbi:MAG: SRPBCC domain-containing protein [Kiritimatiellia bacterium]